MERGITAASRGSFAPAQALVTHISRIVRRSSDAFDPATFRLVRLGTAGLLAGCGLLEVTQGGGSSYSLLLMAGGAVLALATGKNAPAERQVPEAADRSATQSEIILQLAAQHKADRAAPVVHPALSHEAWGDLMARVSHDLRTPLNAVIGFSDVMGSELFGPVGDERYREYIGHIRTSGRELLRSAEDTLAMTELLGGKADAGTALNLETLAGDAIRAAGAADVEFAIDPEIDVVGERRGLRQVLVNLLSEAQLRGSCLSIAARVEDDFVILEVAAKATGSDRPRIRDASLHICMARVLLELQGARLIEIAHDDEWRAVTVLSRAVQPDFFAVGHEVVAKARRAARASTELLPA